MITSYQPIIDLWPSYSVWSTDQCCYHWQSLLEQKINAVRIELYVSAKSIALMKTAICPFQTLSSLFSSYF